MLDANLIIANNIRAELKKENKSQSDLAKEIGLSKKTMSKIMNGARTISAIELRKISECLGVSVGSLLKLPDTVQSFMACVKTKEAKEGIQLADELSDMILFHARIKENGEKMGQSWDADD